MEEEGEGPGEPSRMGARLIMSGLRWRIIVTTLIGTGWLVFVLLYAGFWSQGFSLFQNLVIFFASLIAALGIISALWVSYGFRFGRRRWW